MKSMFWGIFFILIGVMIVLKSVFGINLPLFKLFFAGLFIYWGVSILMSSFSGGKYGVEKRATESEAVFAKSSFKVTTESEGQNDFSTVFGEGELDLTDVDTSKLKEVKINTVFGETKVYLKKGSSYRVVSNTAFGQAKLPERNTTIVGQYTYNSPAVAQGNPDLVLNVNVAFGSFRIEER